MRQQKPYFHECCTHSCGFDRLDISVNYDRCQFAGRSHGRSHKQDSLAVSLQVRVVTQLRHPKHFRPVKVVIREHRDEVVDEAYKSGMIYGYTDGDRESPNDTRIHCNTISKCPWHHLIQGNYNEVLTCQSYFIVLCKVK